MYNVECSTNYSICQSSFDIYHLHHLSFTSLDIQHFIFHISHFTLLIVSLNVRDLLLEFLHLLLLQHPLVLDRNDLDEVFHVAVPVVEHRACELEPV